MPLKQKEAPAKRKTERVKRGLGSASITVKHVRATARQRGVIDTVLGRCQEDGAARRVMIATIMCITQEANAGEGMATTGSYIGLYGQGDYPTLYGSTADRLDADESTHNFLRQWKVKHGGLKKAPGNLAAAIEAIQVSGLGSLYAQWEEEATKTVDTWLDSGGGDGEAEYRTKRYSFTRGEKNGSREDSWEAADRLVKEVGAFRWAAGNVLYVASGDELSAGRPSVTIEGNEGWLRMKPAWSWGSRRPFTEVTLQVLADFWDVMPGGVVLLGRRLGAMSGRWLVFNVSGPSLTSPETTVVLRRPTALRLEPAAERVANDQINVKGKGGGELRDICKQISQYRSAYLYGGGHGPSLSSMKSSTRMDCSSSTSLALHRADMMPGDVAQVSGWFASSWGEPGEGDEFTVWANAGHVWTEFKGPYGRFDTSQHSGESGPAYTTVERSTAGFTPRHWKGH